MEKIAKALGWHVDAVKVSLRDALEHAMADTESWKALVVFRKFGKTFRVTVDNGGNFIWGITVETRKEGRDLVALLSKTHLTTDLLRNLNFEYLK